METGGWGGIAKSSEGPYPCAFREVTNFSGYGPGYGRRNATVWAVVRIQSRSAITRRAAPVERLTPDDWATLNQRARRRKSFTPSFVSHSQTVRTRHPRAFSSLACLSSRSRLPASFGSQKSLRVAGTFPREQSCPCQKQPWTKTTAWWRLRTMSGDPGNEA